MVLDEHDEIFDMIGTLGRIVDAQEKTRRLLDGYRHRIEQIRATTATWTQRPKVYFEEWDEPIISGIQWVSELIEIAGGEDVFPELATEKGAAQRQPSAAQVIEANPDIIVASWCGKPVDQDAIRQRPGFDQIAAIQHDQLFEMDPSIILQPGPARSTSPIQ